MILKVLTATENGDFMVLKVLTATENGNYRRGAEGGKIFLGLF